MMEQFDKIRATFTPQRTDDLRYGAEKCIGWEGEWTACWIIEDGDYEGQWAMSPDREKPWPMAWVPLCDLTPALALPGIPAVSPSGMGGEAGTP